MIDGLNSSWTLFLDRDGVINKRLMGDYVKKVEEFEFLDGVLEALVLMSNYFSRTVVVTNQQGIGKGLMSQEDLTLVHQHMIEAIQKVGGKIDQIYYCPELAEKNAKCRKPNTGMAEQAQRDFPEINFQNSIMVGDSISDLEFGKRLGMLKVYINEEGSSAQLADLSFKSLAEFAASLDLK